MRFNRNSRREQMKEACNAGCDERVREDALLPSESELFELLETADELKAPEQLTTPEDSREFPALTK